jgi:hypothetical protein
MSKQTTSAIHAAWGPYRATVHIKPRLVVAGATGALGSEVLRRLAGHDHYAHTEVLAKEPIKTGLPSVSMVLVGNEEADESIENWPALPKPAQVAVVMFEPPRLYYDRERALWTPVPEQLLPLAQWLRHCGVHTLAVVMPHPQGRLPDALKHGLANLDEHAVAALGFERLLLVRSAQKMTPPAQAGFLNKTAAWMLSTLSYMIPQTGQAIRPTRLAEFIEAALRVLPPGTHVASPELLWQAANPPAADKRNGVATSHIHAVIQAWLNGKAAASLNPEGR